jgi:hypothetical protein
MPFRASNFQNDFQGIDFEGWGSSNGYVPVLGDPQPKMTGVTIQVPHTPSVSSRDVDDGSGFDVWRSL